MAMVTKKKGDLENGAAQLPTTICKAFDFDAAHHLPNMPEGHKCRREHGHTYRVEVRFRGAVVQRTGLLLDYGEIAEAWAPIHELLDHRNLNDLFENPTTEVVVQWIAIRFVGWLALREQRESTTFNLHSVRLYESSTTWAEVLW